MRLSSAELRRAGEGGVAGRRPVLTQRSGQLPTKPLNVPPLERQAHGGPASHRTTVALN